MESIRTMLIVQFLNRSITDQFRPYFEIIYVFEFFFLLLFPVVAIRIMQATWRTTSYHRNIRLRIIVSSVLAIAYTSARVFILFHQ
ncbi:hypothetical protein PENTCL1PPCAC_17151, partial [Pristionchus entomophagus]